MRPKPNTRYRSDFSLVYRPLKNHFNSTIGNIFISFDSEILINDLLQGYEKDNRSDGCEIYSQYFKKCVLNIVELKKDVLEEYRDYFSEMRPLYTRTLFITYDKDKFNTVKINFEIYNDEYLLYLYTGTKILKITKGSIYNHEVFIKDKNLMKNILKVNL